MRFLVFLLVAFHLWLTLVQPAHAGSANVAVTVTGTGPTLELARSDATRQALQQTISQLVVVDREISGNTVLRDRVLSTMNGYIDKFVVRREIKTGAEFSVTADVVVSASRIENFIGIITSAGGSFDGSSLLAERARRQAQTQADLLQRKARGEIFDNVLRPFPSKAISVRTLGITLSDTNPDELRITVEVTHNPEFIKALEGTVKALSEVACAPVQRPAGDGHHVYDKAFRASLGAFWDRDCPGGMTETTPYTIYRAHPDRPIVCLGYASIIQCYELAPGDYCSSCQLVDDGQGSKSFVLFGRFVDRFGQSVNASGSCLEKRAARRNLFDAYLGKNGRGPGGHMGFATFDFASKRTEIVVRTSELHLDRAKHFVGVGAIFGPKGAYGNPGVVTSMLADQDGQQSGCALLDEAVHIRQLEGFDDSVGNLR